MSARMKRTLVLVGLATVFAGCSAFASKSEYVDYREVRMAEERDAKLLAMQEYVSEHPQGTWAEAVQAERVELEPEVWEESRSTREGLEFYLRAFPDGPHAAEARPRLAALQTVAGRRENEEEQAREVERQRREELAERRRTWLTRAAAFWTSTMIGIDNWGSPIADVARQNPTFSRAFGQNPQPRCSREECIKFYRANYAIPVPGSTRIDRQVELLLRLKMDEGRVQRAELLLPNKGFSRWYEQENRTIVVDEDPTQRQQAIEWALERLIPAIREHAPNAEAIDVVPEPIDPPQITAPDDADPGASRAPGDAPVEAGEAGEGEGEGAGEGEQGAEGEGQQGDAEGEGEQGGLDALLERAAGSEDEEPERDPQQAAPAPEPEPETMVLPIALQGFRAANLRIVLFAAAEEDYGAAYDGLFIEIADE